MILLEVMRLVSFPRLTTYHSHHQLTDNAAQPQAQTQIPTTAINKRKRDVSFPPDSEKDDKDDVEAQSEEMKATLQAIAATQADLTIELLRNTSNTSNGQSSMSYIHFSNLQSESDDHLFHPLSILRMLQHIISQSTHFQDRNWNTFIPSISSLVVVGHFIDIEVSFVSLLV
jgi:hypothetical protein